MSILKLRKKLTDYLQVADDKKIKAIYLMVEDDMNTIANDWDEAYVKELTKRSEDFQNGTAKTYSWKETKTAAVKRVKAKKK